MSYHLNQELPNKPAVAAKKIEMPPLPELPEDPQAQQQALQQQIQSRQKPQTEQTYEVHPDIAREFVQPTVESEPEEPQVQEASQEVEEEVESAPAPKVESQNAKNIRAIREKAERAERAERERDELMKRLHDLEIARFQQQQQQAKPVVEEKEEPLPESDDDWVPVKHLRKYDKTIKELKEELSSYRQQTTMASVDARLKSKYPDIDAVVCKENLDTLRATYPELADSINAGSDLYNKAAAAYTLIKKLGIAPEDNYVEDKIKAQKNAVKPRPLASVNPQQGDSPLSKANAFANGLTDDLKAQLRREMENARKNM